MLSDGMEKAQAIIEFAKANNREAPSESFIETGTSFGATFDAVLSSDYFSYHHTIESDHDKYITALERFSFESVIHANSGKYLPRLIDVCAPLRQTIYLDAHDTDVEAPTPIMDELRHILHRSYVGRQDGSLTPGHLIIIDDARLFGTGVWPKIADILDLMCGTSLYDGSLANDLIYLQPL